MAELFEYALVRVVPRVERGECMNVGVLLWCQGAGYLDVRCVLDAGRLAALDPFLDLAALRTHLAALHQVCVGGPAAGAAGVMSPGERFRWLTAPRSTVVQTSPVHTGVTADPAAELDRLVALLVDRQGPPAAAAG
ncbi:DUF3037 domain-containing protein [Frankia sp. CNm7]|uniref:DUF3037 domain-containing protein n=1 Tax=Frankia nepalensis TaxID=1836974 RepID=A0A937UU06_9ACTN|nr:DUF3037 domain-containing protein [Frankia nepalensis]MBL7501881.1 DUF3037 domain-containing protein [Frankia nepalensis]MBL7511621.1 DUF3037 domain-containing protein [Frankia nepalensis]MBL7523672.1 DUF3037 domain-containing protein [Frankia nepalensis]MBL7633613.1 DUF3037 domain-containing protein [Frankia nepalensis]